jgi:hypothetical protein
MLVTFESKVGRITMFGDIAVQLLRMMGHSGTVPGALLAPDIPEALAKLRSALAVAGETDSAGPADDEEETPEKAVRVSLRTRAFPLIQLLEDAAKQGSDVLWDQGS